MLWLTDSDSQRTATLCPYEWLRDLIEEDFQNEPPKGVQRRVDVWIEKLPFDEGRGFFTSFQ